MRCSKKSGFKTASFILSKADWQVSVPTKTSGKERNGGFFLLPKNRSFPSFFLCSKMFPKKTPKFFKKIYDRYKVFVFPAEIHSVKNKRCNKLKQFVASLFCIIISILYPHIMEKNPTLRIASIFLFVPFDTFLPRHLSFHISASTLSYRLFFLLRSGFYTKIS